MVFGLYIGLARRTEIGKRLQIRHGGLDSKKFLQIFQLFLEGCRPVGRPTFYDDYAVGYVQYYAIPCSMFTIVNLTFISRIESRQQTTTNGYKWDS